jgi:hypothetical protein
MIDVSFPIPCSDKVLQVSLQEDVLRGGEGGGGGSDLSDGAEEEEKVGRVAELGHRLRWNLSEFGERDLRRSLRR